MFRLSKDKELDLDTLAVFIEQHNAEVVRRYQKLEDAYLTDYEILHYEPKPKWKPDNRIPVNFAKYITDTFNGFFLGIPVKITVDDEGDGGDRIASFVELVTQYNDMDDKLVELSKICGTFGKGYEMYYVDENGYIGIEKLTPIDAFMIYDDSVLKRPRFFVRLYKDSDDILHGSVSDTQTVRYFIQKGELEWDGEPHLHGFVGNVPAVEFKENEEEQGIFEPVLPMINAYNKALSEKANDVDYFADAYLKVLGTFLNEDEIKHIRDDRIINFDGDVEKLIVEFLQKPNGDETQEHLIDRLEKLIFQISMVADISDENFGTSSGIALKYKLLAMSNLAKAKERKFISGMNKRFKIIFSNPITRAYVKPDDWVKLKYKFTQNFPANLLEEAQIASQMEGITSQETQLKVLSVVDSVENELEKIKSENEQLAEDVVGSFMFGRQGNNDDDINGDGDVDE